MTTASDQDTHVNAAAPGKAVKASAEVVKIKTPRAAKAKAEDPRRAALAEEFSDEIAQHQAQFGETREQAIDRVIAEQEELDSLIGNILAIAA